MNPTEPKKTRRKQNLILRHDFRMEEPIEMLDYGESKADGSSKGSALTKRHSSSDVTTKLVTQTSDSSTGIQFTYKKVERCSGSSKSSKMSNSSLDRSASFSDGSETNNSFSMSCPDYYQSVDPNSILPHNTTHVKTESDCQRSKQTKSKLAMKAGAVKVKKNLELFYTEGKKSCKVCNAVFDSLQDWCKHTIVIHPAYAKELSLEETGDHVCSRCQHSYTTVEGLHYHEGLSIC